MWVGVGGGGWRWVGVVGRGWGWVGVGGRGDQLPTVELKHAGTI